MSLQTLYRKAHFIQSSRYIKQIVSFQVAETSAQLRRMNSFFFLELSPAILGDNTGEFAVLHHAMRAQQYHYLTSYEHGIQRISL